MNSSSSAHSSDSKSSSAPVSAKGAISNKAYPWLLGISTCLSAALCYLYITKPVIIAAPEGAVAVEDASAASGVTTSSAGKGNVHSSSKTAKPSLLPSDNALPGMKSGAKSSTAKASRKRGPRSVNPRKLVASGDGTGWETTNARVQHILSADAGNGELTKIVLNVPVLYQTRTMRWTPTDVKKAREVLTRLMVYENSLAKIKNEGKVLLADWNRLLEKTVPSASLRADSPSLPYNHSRQDGVGNLPDSGNTIKIEP